MNSFFKIRRFVALIACFMVTQSGFAFQQSYDAEAGHLLTQVEAQLEEVREELVAFRRDIHQHPEVSGEEKRTSRAIVKRLKALDLEVRQQVGGYGVVALLKGGHPGPVVAFRADMDAVYSNAEDPVSFASKVPGVRHICGHDIHTSVGVALAEGMASIQEELHGSVMFLFQPAEENVQGARAMIEEGVFKKTKPNAIFAYHTASMQVGQIATKPGVMLPSRHNLIIELEGDNGLAEAGASVKELVQAQNTLSPGQNSTTEDFLNPGNVRTQMRSEEGKMRVFTTVTSSSEDLRKQALATIKKKLVSLESAGISHSIVFTETAAGVQNDEALEKASRAALQSVIGEENLLVIDDIPTPFSEDFGFFQYRVPGVMYFLGVSNAEKGWVGFPHSPGYVADEEAIFVGAKAMAAVMLDFMDR